ncbi:thermonuclease family protein [Mesorhizobium sp. NBSH29]|uniref:thermonuclease family protein n=1 Tax=Mesorhizobium sp. NBSH29 TaxID=2654249 RepID=UPI0018965DE8|nr:thermonuclease family protein [Mesorhizobium sp. NBSH29]QPC88003.1 thermonuclease family protein [Mesorhizobium sp. NBSH29]
MSSSWNGRARTNRSRRPRSLWRQILDYGVAAAILFLLVVVSARVDIADTRQTAGQAVINDGDSLTLGKERVRLRGIDAPEYNQTCTKDGTSYLCGRLSREALVRLIARRPVVCKGGDHDRYGRILGRCSAGDTDLNRLQVEAGWAVAYGDYEDEEKAAREAKRGLWAGSFDRPRRWRDSHGALVEGEHQSVRSLWDWLKTFVGSL